ncbi:MAG: hypothetical protein FD137_812 [Spirochaetes bacterium]|nr:MAG: hypothetical protein FD137_812 [Spirochaetota bacterium]
MKRKFLAALAALWVSGALAFIPAYAQDFSGGERFMVAEALFVIEGSTRIGALKDYLDIHEGRRFDSLLELEYYVAEKERLLRDNRVFEPNSTVRFESMGQGDPAPIRIVVEAKDTWTILALPFPKFSVDDGASLALRYKDFNFAGTLVPLTLNFDHYLVLKRSTLGAAFGLDLEFLGAPWDFSFDGALRANHGAEAPFYDNFTLDGVSASFSGEYRLGALERRWSLHPFVRHLYKIGETAPTFDAGLKGVRYFGGSLDWIFSLSSGYRMTAEGSLRHAWTNDASLGFTLPLARLASKATFSASPSLLASLNLDLPGGSPADPYVGLRLQSGYGAVDWAGSFRRGSSVNLAAEYLSYWNEDNPALRRDAALTLQAQGFAAFGNVAGANLRFTGRWDLGWTIFGQTWDPTAIDWADYLRGVTGDLYGDLGAAINIELPLNFAQGRFFTLPALEAEIIFSPFIDLGFVRTDPAAPLDFLAQGFAAAGAELILFPRFARSFVYRFSVGYDFLPLARGAAFDVGDIEAWLGIGLLF